MSVSDVGEALDRLIDLAGSDTGQARRAANFLLAWWDGAAWGDFAIADLFGVDRSVADDMVTIFAYLGQHPGAVYADAFGRRDAMDALVRRLRSARAVA
jgi:hypothetical protein